MTDTHRDLLSALPEEGAISTGELGRFVGLYPSGASSRPVQALLREGLVVAERIGRHDYLALTDEGRATRRREDLRGQAPASDIAATLGHGADVFRIVAAKPGIKGREIQRELEEAYPDQMDFALMRHVESSRLRGFLTRVDRNPRRGSSWEQDFWLTRKGRIVLSWIKAGRNREDRLDAVLARAA